MVKIAIISDIHFGKDGRPNEFRLINDEHNGYLSNAPKLTEGAINELKKYEIDYLFVCGDLTSEGNPAEFFCAEEVIKRIADGLEIADDKIIWCIGNHDNDWNISGLADLCEYSGDLQKKIVEKYEDLSSKVAINHMSIYPKLIAEGPCPMSGVFEDDNIIVFVLNSSTKCVKKRVVENGIITREQLAWLEIELRKYVDCKKWKIVLMHHHPFNYQYPLDGLDISLLQDGSELNDLLGKYGVNLVIHGHRHHPKCKTVFENEWKNPISFVSCGSFSVDSPQRNIGDIPNTFHIIELQDEIGVLKLFTYEYNSGEGWKKVKDNRPTVPVDFCMYLGKFFDDKKINAAIDKMFIDISDGIKYIKWNDLDESLKFISSRRLQEWFDESEWSKKYKIDVKIGEYILIAEGE